MWSASRRDVDKLADMHVKVCKICSQYEKPNVVPERIEYDAFTQRWNMINEFVKTRNAGRHVCNGYHDDNSSKPVPAELNEGGDRVMYDVSDVPRYVDATLA